MEKLIELLNEYERNVVMKSYMHPVYYYNEDENKILNLYIGFNTDDEVKYQWLLSYIVSARYGFIKWLVDNDKIDIKALVVKGEMRSGWDFDNKKGNEESGEEIWNKYYSELCLMLLSISDTPIEDLISYLK